MKRFFGRVDIDAGKYAYIVKIEDGRAYWFHSELKEWVEKNEFHDARFDTTHYDELTEQEAMRIIAAEDYA